MHGDVATVGLVLMFLCSQQAKKSSLSAHGPVSTSPKSYLSTDVLGIGAQLCERLTLEKSTTKQLLHATM